jgi:hypothetical protein
MNIQINDEKSTQTENKQVKDEKVQVSIKPNRQKGIHYAAKWMLEIIFIQVYKYKQKSVVWGFNVT